MRDPGVDEGATTVAYVPEKGWFWYIPLPRRHCQRRASWPRRTTSTTTRETWQTIFHREVEKNPWIKQHLAVGEQFGPYRVTGEYSYRSRTARPMD